AVHFVRRQFAGRQLPAGGAGVGDEFSPRVMRVSWAPVIAALLFAAAGCGSRHAAQATFDRAQRRNLASANDGARVYITNCSSCHQLDGRGVPGAFAPLAGNPVVTGDPRRLLAIVADGRRGPIRVAGHVYDGEMPAWKGLLSDGEIAAVVSYIRAAWRNNA